VANSPCMKDCIAEVKVGSSLPAQAKGSHGDLSQQSRPIGAAAPTKAVSDTKATALVSDTNSIADLARRKACLSCHGVDNKIVGPAFRDVARRYKGQEGIEAKLVEKLKRGGSGNWGPLPMPPNPDLPQADATALVRWVLGL